MIKIRLFGPHSPEKEELTGDEALGHVGLYIIYHQILKDRLEKLEELMKQFYREKDPIRKIDIANHIITETVLPWGRGGDNPYFLKMLNAWNQLVALIRSWSIYREKAEKTGEDIAELDNIYRRIIEEELASAMQTIISASFFDRDISKNLVTIIHTFSEPTVKPQKDSVGELFRMLLEKKQGGDNE